MYQQNNQMQMQSKNVKQIHPAQMYSASIPAPAYYSPMYPNQQQGVAYPPPMTQPQPQQQTQYMNANQSPYPVTVKCPSCNQVSTTNVTTKAGSGTYTLCFIMCLFTGCCCIPFCIDECQDKVHNCPKCQAVVGVKEYKIF